MKTLTTIFSVLLVCSLGLKSAKAQEKDDPVTIEQVSNPGIHHNSAIKEFGIDYQFAKSTLDDQTNSMSAGNRGVIRQYGDNNTATLSQTGKNNQGLIQMGSPNDPVSGNTANVKQEGQGLISIVDMQGNNNFLDFEQQGENRGASFDFSGGDLQFNAKQSGANLQLTPKSSTRPAINISSTRRVLPVIISNN